jgi:hypothetical protein
MSSNTEGSDILPAFGAAYWGLYLSTLLLLRLWICRDCLAYLINAVFLLSPLLPSSY